MVIASQMKAVITAAGLGTRSGLDGKLRKEMLPVYDRRDGELVLRPMIDCIMTRLSDAGADELIVVLDPEDFYTQGYVEREFPEAVIAFQNEKKGFGDAVLKARPYLKGENFILNAGDGLVLLPDHVDSVIRMAEEDYDRSLLTLFHVPNPQRYGTAGVQKEGNALRVTEVVEKSRTPPSSLALAAFYYLNYRVLDFIRDSGSGIELTPAINSLIKTGMEVAALEIGRKDWASVGLAKEYVEVLQRTLQKLG